MTESDYLRSDSPSSLLSFLRVRLTERKMRLIAIAVARHGGCGSWANVAHLLHAAEQMAEGKPHGLSERDIQEAQPYSAAWLITEKASDAVRMVLDHYEPDVEDRTTGAGQASLLREIAGPFAPRPCHCDPDVGIFTCEWCDELKQWQTWNAGIVPRMAAKIYEERDWDALPVLADALEDSGCHDEAILAHLRQECEPGMGMCDYHQHVRGCWVLDLLLQRS